MPHAVPVIFPIGPDDYNNGSGFLLRAESRLWLCTAAHVPILNQMQVHNGRWLAHRMWDKWPELLIVPGPPISPNVPFTPLASVPLFVPGPSLEPGFAYLDCETHIADLLILPLESEHALPSSRLSQFTKFELGAVWPQVGMDANAFGYVKIGTTITDRQQAGTVTGTLGELVEHTNIASDGMSGGPLVSVNGNLFGMTIGHENGSGIAIGQSAITRAISAFLASGRAHCS